LVTGGAGFISHVTDALADDRHSVQVIDDLFSGYQQNVSPNAGFVKASVPTRTPSGPSGGRPAQVRLSPSKRSAHDP
jgi:nucleoside-diphosphate-sugar epimerase